MNFCAILLSFTQFSNNKRNKKIAVCDKERYYQWTMVPAMKFKHMEDSATTRHRRNRIGTCSIETCEGMICVDDITFKKILELQ